MKAIDADGHVVEPLSMLEEYVPDHVSVAWRRVTDVSVNGVNVVDRPDAEFFVLPESAGRYAELARRGFDSASQLEVLDQEGFAAAVLYPSKFLYLPYATGIPAGVSAALTRAYDEWLYDFCQRDSERLMGVAPLPLGDVDEACRQARHAVEQLGFRAVMVRPNPVAGRNLGNPAYDPLYALLAELDVPLTVHEGLSVRVPQLGRDRFDDFFSRHMYSHPMEQMAACLSLIAGGALERHPRLRVAFLESGSGWVPYWLHRMDEHAEYARPDVADLTMRPSDYFRRQCFVSCEADDEVVRYTADYLDGGNIVFASDYPHPDAPYPGVLEPFLEARGLDESARERILWDNACELLGLNPAATRARSVPAEVGP